MQDDGNLVLYDLQGCLCSSNSWLVSCFSVHIGTYLIAGQSIHANQCIVSPHGQYFLYMAPDGNFYIYD